MQGRCLLFILSEVEGRPQPKITPIVIYQIHTAALASAGSPSDVRPKKIIAPIAIL
jgi:hypothetical protein